MSYLINFITKTLGITSYILPLGVVIVGAAILTGVSGILFDKYGRKHFYMPLLIVIVMGTILVYLMKFMPSSAYLPILIAGGILMLGCMLCMGGALMSAFQDYIPKGYEGRFQGVRMCFSVLIPMIIGPIITLAIGINFFDTKDALATTNLRLKIFLAATIVAFLRLSTYFVARIDTACVKLRLQSGRGGTYLGEDCER